ncbi:hypothetical protein MMC07_008164 [Pseudocyphellaria aurata]|nr:hypothetical protein [Pseudocyphellaria aurata]
MDGPSDQSTKESTSGNDSENPSTANEEVTSSTANQVATESSSTNNIPPPDTRREFLSLPAELRMIVYRHLLVEQDPISTDHQPFPPMLITCELIRNEAFRVMYEENTFFIGRLHPTTSILNNREIHDTIQNVDFKARLSTLPGDRHRVRTKFVHVVREFGVPEIIRNTLYVTFRVGPYGNNPLLQWISKGLPVFTNFKTIRFEFVPSSLSIRAHELCPLLCAVHERNFVPVFGPAESFAQGRGVLFHPLKYLLSIPPKEEVDWMDNLDGIRLDYNEDPSVDE